MRHLFLIGLCAFSIFAQAEKGFYSACVTEIPTTTFVVTEEGDFLNVSVLHHNGVKYMPFFNGVITPFDIAELQRQADSMMKMGEALSVKFPKDKCSFYGEGVFTCYHGEIVKIGDEEYDVFAIHSSLVSNKSQGYNFINRVYTLSVYVNNKRQQISMPYDMHDCVFENEPRAP